MMPVMFMALVIVALLAVAFLVMFLGADRRTLEANERLLSRDERAELRARRELDDRIKELAWDHRDIAPELATIIIDEIRSFERRQHRGELDS